MIVWRALEGVFSHQPRGSAVGVGGVFTRVAGHLKFCFVLLVEVLNKAPELLPRDSSSPFFSTSTLVTPI